MLGHKSIAFHFLIDSSLEDVATVGNRLLKQLLPTDDKGPTLRTKFSIQLKCLSEAARLV